MHDVCDQCILKYVLMHRRFPNFILYDIKYLLMRRSFSKFHIVRHLYTSGFWPRIASSVLLLLHEQIKQRSCMTDRYCTYIYTVHRADKPTNYFNTLDVCDMYATCLPTSHPCRLLRSDSRSFQILNKFYLIF
jgi:hypothetical protein